jgi:hypothetical protein
MPRLLCDFQYYWQAADLSLQFGDSFLARLFSALEECIQTIVGDLFPEGDELWLQLVQPGDLGWARRTGEDFENDLGLEVGAEKIGSRGRA